MSAKRVFMLSTACLLTCASVATVQAASKSFTPVSKDCSGIQWSSAALATYPNIASACQGVMERDGISYVKFSGTVAKTENQGQRLVVDFKDGGKVTLTPPPQTNLYVNGQKTAVSKLARGDELNFYIAQDRLAAQFPDTAEVQTAHMTLVPIVVHEHERMASLPSTASDWPLAAFSGMMLLSFGGFLTWSRRRR